MQRKDRDRERQGQKVQNKKRKKPRVVFSSRKVIEASRMRQTKTRSRVAEVDSSVPKAIKFGEDEVVCPASVSRCENLTDCIRGGEPSIETLICEADGDTRVSDSHIQIYSTSRILMQ